VGESLNIAEEDKLCEREICACRGVHRCVGEDTLYSNLWRFFKKGGPLRLFIVLNLHIKVSENDHKR
jgi:hypothetical protein